MSIIRRASIHACWPALLLAAMPGCRREAEPKAPVVVDTVPLRSTSIQQLESLVATPGYFRDSSDRVTAFIAELKTNKPIPPTIVAAWYAHDRPQSKLMLLFYDESQRIRGFRIKSKEVHGPVVYDYVVYLEHSRNSDPLETVLVEVLAEPHVDGGPRTEVPIQKVPGGVIRAWVPTPQRDAPVTICLLDADGQEHACTPLSERPAPPNTQPATAAP